MRDARMSRRLSQAPRLSLVWTAISIEQNTAATAAAASAEQSNDIMADDGDTSKRGSLRDFCCNHVKSIATTVMMFGMIFCVVMIVMGKLVRYLFTIYTSVFLCGIFTRELVSLSLISSNRPTCQEKYNIGCRFLKIVDYMFGPVFLLMHRVRVLE